MTKEIGILNPGNLCYVNVVINLLHKIESFRKAILSLPLKDNPPILTSLRNIFSNLDAGVEPPDPSDFFEKCGYGEKSVSIQDDARDFCQFLLAELEFELQLVEKEGFSSLVKNIFEMVLEETTSAPELSVPIVECLKYLIFDLNPGDSNNFEDSLNNALNSEFQYKTSKDGVLPLVYVEAEKKIKFKNTPPVLMFALNRFQYNADRKETFKDQKFISFPLEFDLGPSAVSQNSDGQYILVSIIAHRGQLHRGHYLFYNRNDDFNSWTCFDDSSVSMVTQKDIQDLFGPGFSGRAPRKVKNENVFNYSPVAFQLVYLKKSGAAEVRSNLKIPVTVPNPPPIFDPIPHPNPTEDEVESRDRLELEQSLENSLDEFMEIHGDVLSRLQPLVILKKFQEKLQEKLNFTEYLIVPKKKNNSEIVFDLPVQQDVFDTFMYETYAQSLTEFFLPKTTNEKNPLIQKANEEMKQKIGKVVDVSDENSIFDKLKDKIYTEIFTKKSKWKKIPCNLPCPGFCGTCDKQKNDCWPIDENGLNFMCDACRAKEIPKPVKRKKGKSKSGESHKCSNCEKCFTKKSSLTEHMRIHTGQRPFQCSECEKSFTQKSTLTEHMIIHTGQRPFQCSECEKSFTQKSTLTEHMGIHTGQRPFQCSACEQSFTRKSTLTDHLKRHTGQRPFQCSNCEKCFTRKSSLTEHMKSHSGQRKFPCSQCGKIFAQKSTLTEHMIIHTGQRPFQCSNCKKSFTRKRNLTMHLRTHTGQRPFLCSECGKTFTRKDIMMSHMRRHTGQRPFQCSECEKSFTQKTGLTKHMRIHNGQRPFQCSECEKSFKRKDTMMSHMKTKHQSKK